MATHFQIIEKTEENGEQVIWSDVFRSDNIATPFSVDCMFNVQKDKGKFVMLTKWTSGDKDVTILKKSWEDLNVGKTLFDKAEVREILVQVINELDLMGILDNAHDAKEEAEKVIELFI